MNRVKETDAINREKGQNSRFKRHTVFNAHEPYDVLKLHAGIKARPTALPNTI